MTFLPIVARELRVAARRRGSYWSRCASAAMAIILGVLIYWGSMGSIASMGRSLFEKIAIFAFLYCITAGMRLTADCLSEEKREGTLGLLFLTDLKGYDVVAGKLVASSLNGFYGLLAVLPVLAVSLLLGGVTNAEVWRMALVLVNIFFFSLALGILMSSVSINALKSYAAVFCIVIIAPVVMLWFERIPAIMQQMPFFQYVLALLNPMTSAFLASDYSSIPVRKMFWASVAAMHILGWIFFGFASLIVPRSWQDQPGAAGRQNQSENLQDGNQARLVEPQAFRRKLLDSNAFLWLCARDRFRSMPFWVVFFIVAVLGGWARFEYGGLWGDIIIAIFILIMNLTLKICITAEAGRKLGEDRKNGALELLLSTPLSVADILKGQLLAMKRHFLVPWLTLLAAETIYLLSLPANKTFDVDDDFAYWAVSILVFLVADVPALTLVAMWAGLTKKSPARSMMSTLQKILVLPIVITVAALIAYALLSEFVVRTEPSRALLLSCYYLPGLGADLFFGLMAWWNLKTQFREVATLRFSPRVPLWRRPLGVPAVARE